jgi:hypothetical protein
VLFDAGHPSPDWAARAEVCREVSRRDRVEFLDEEAPLIVLAVPCSDAEGRPVVAVATFLTRSTAAEEDVSQAALALGLPVEETVAWADGQTAWSPEALERMAQLVKSQWDARRQIARLEAETRERMQRR